jgi:hypothetical protein
MLDETTYDWARTVHGKVKEELPKNAPKPKGRYVVTTTYVDANLYHDMLTGRSITLPPSCTFLTKPQLNGSRRNKLQWKQPRTVQSS